MVMPNKRRSVFNRLRYLVGGNVARAKSELKRRFGVDHPDKLSTLQLGELIELVGHGKFGVTDFRRTPINADADTDDIDAEPARSVAELIPATIKGKAKIDPAAILKHWNKGGRRDVGSRRKPLRARLVK